MKTNHYHSVVLAIAVIAIALQACDRSAKQMQEQKVAAIIEANDELFNKGNLDHADKVFAVDYSGGGPGLIKNFISARRAAFPDLQVKIDPVISDGQMVAWLRTNTGTQTGDYAGRKSTNKKITWKEMIFTRYNEEGKIAEEWGVSEMREMLNAASDIDGVYQYLLPLKGQGVNRNGRFIYLFGLADGKGPMTSQAGTQTISGDTVTNTIEFSTDPRQIGTTYLWRITSLSGDTTTYQIMDSNGKITGSSKAVKINH